MSKKSSQGPWIEEWAVSISAALCAVWCFTRSLIFEDGKTGRCGIKKAFWQYFLFTVILLVSLWLLDPIGVASNSARASAALFYRIISPEYQAPTLPGKAGSGRASDDNTGIAVIVINDKTLQTIEPKQPWPPPFSVHAEIVEKILIFNPKALFIDIGFFDARKDPSLAKFVETLEWRLGELAATRTVCTQLFRKSVGCHPDDGKTQRQVPVFLVGAPKSSGLEVIPALKRAVTGTVSTRYSTEHELPYNAYPLFDCFTGKPSAALAIYAAFRDDWTAWGLDLTPCQSRQQRKIRDWAGGANMMSVYWASWGSAGRSRGSYSCRSLPETRLGRLAQVVEIWFRELLQDDPAWQDQFQTCPPHRSYAAHAFLADGSTELAAFLKDRYVFYGANFIMADDLITPPTHEPVPGVFLHAMALDNLLRFGGDYLRLESGAGLSSATSWLTLLAILLVSLFTVLAWDGFEALIKRPESHAAPGAAPKTNHPQWSKAELAWERLRPVGRYLIGGGWIFVTLSGSVFCVLAIAHFSFSILNFAPFNFVGILSFVGIHTIVRSTYGLLTSIAGGA